MLVFPSKWFIISATIDTFTRNIIRISISLFLCGTKSPDLIVSFPCVMYTPPAVGLPPVVISLVLACHQPLDYCRSSSRRSTSACRFQLKFFVNLPHSPSIFRSNYIISFLCNNTSISSVCWPFKSISTLICVDLCAVASTGTMLSLKGPNAILCSDTYIQQYLPFLTTTRHPNLLPAIDYVLTMTMCIKPGPLFYIFCCLDFISLLFEVVSNSLRRVNSSSFHNNTYCSNTYNFTLLQFSIRGFYFRLNLK